MSNRYLRVAMATGASLMFYAFTAGLVSPSEVDIQIVHMHPVSFWNHPLVALATAGFWMASLAWLNHLGKDGQ